MVNLDDPDLIMPAGVQSSAYRPIRGTMDNSLRRELAEYLLHNITPPEAILDIVQGESFQGWNIVLNKCHSSVRPAKEKGWRPYLLVDRLTLRTVEVLSLSIWKRSRRSSICDYPPIHRVQTRSNQCRDRAKMPETCQIVRGAKT